jgi:hypothetical protein
MMTATEKTTTKKFGGLTIALIILCVVFIAATIGVTAYLTSLTSARGIASTATLELGIAAVVIVIVIIFAAIAAVMLRKRP